MGQRHATQTATNKRFARVAKVGNVALTVIFRIFTCWLVALVLGVTIACKKSTVSYDVAPVCRVPLVPVLVRYSTVRIDRQHTSHRFKEHLWWVCSSFAVLVSQSAEVPTMLFISMMDTVSVSGMAGCTKNGLCVDLVGFCT